MTWEKYGIAAVIVFLAFAIIFVGSNSGDVPEPHSGQEGDCLVVADNLEYVPKECAHSAVGYIYHQTTRITMQPVTSNISVAQNDEWKVTLIDQEYPGGIYPNTDFITEYEGFLVLDVDRTANYDGYIEVVHTFADGTQLHHERHTSQRLSQSEDYTWPLSRFNARSIVRTGPFTDLEGHTVNITPELVAQPSHIRVIFHLTRQRQPNPFVLQHATLTLGKVTFYQLGATEEGVVAIGPQGPQGEFIASVFSNQDDALTTFVKPSGGVYNITDGGWTRLPAGWTRHPTTPAEDQVVVKADVVINPANHPRGGAVPIANDCASDLLTGCWSDAYQPVEGLHAVATDVTLKGTGTNVSPLAVNASNVQRGDCLILVENGFSGLDCGAITDNPAKPPADPASTGESDEAARADHQHGRDQAISAIGASLEAIQKQLGELDFTLVPTSTWKPTTDTHHYAGFDGNPPGQTTSQHSYVQNAITIGRFTSLLPVIGIPFAVTRPDGFRIRHTRGDTLIGTYPDGSTTFWRQFESAHRNVEDTFHVQPYGLTSSTDWQSVSVRQGDIFTLQARETTYTYAVGVDSLTDALASRILPVCSEASTTPVWDGSAWECKPYAEPPVTEFNVYSTLRTTMWDFSDAPTAAELATTLTARDPKVCKPNESCTFTLVAAGEDPPAQVIYAWPKTQQPSTITQQGVFGDLKSQCGPNCIVGETTIDSQTYQVWAYNVSSSAFANTLLAPSDLMGTWTLAF